MNLCLIHQIFLFQIIKISLLIKNFLELSINILKELHLLFKEISIVFPFIPSFFSSNSLFVINTGNILEMSGFFNIQKKPNIFSLFFILI